MKALHIFIKGTYFVGKSLSYSLKIGSFINALGGWVKHIAFNNYILALLGQGLITLSSNLFMAASNSYKFYVFFIIENIILDVANIWFHDNERFMVITIGIFSNPLGAGIGYLVSPLIIQDNSVILHIYIFKLYIIY